MVMFQAEPGVEIKARRQSLLLPVNYRQGLKLRLASWHSMRLPRERVLIFASELQENVKTAQMCERRIDRSIR